jgi:hypothetical protein
MTNGTARPCHRHVVAGIPVACEVPLPTFEYHGVECSVDVRAGRLSSSEETWADARRRFRAAPNRWRFDADDGCRFSVEAGRDVIYEQARATSDEVLAEQIMQPVLGALLHQRGLLALHASAIASDTGVVALLGRTGSGKSSLAVWFHVNGRLAVADDVCPIDVTSAPMFTGGSGYLKVSPDLLRQLAIDDRDVRTIPGDTRGRVRLRTLEAPRPARPLTAVYLLRRVEESSPAPTIRRLAPTAAVEALVRHTYRRQYLRGLGLLARQFAACAVVSRHVPVKEIRFSRTSCDVETVGRAVVEDLGRDDQR